MKLQELAVISPTKQAAKVFESYFGSSVPFEQLTKRQAQHMLTRVRGLIREHRGQTAFHRSEQNPAYLKLVVMEQGLASKVNEDMPVASGGVAAPAVNPAQAGMDMAKAKKTAQDTLKQLQDQKKQLDLQIAAAQKAISQPAMGMAESRRRIAESEVQQAQVVLASQDMVDQVQKMIEQVTAMQFKDLPALVDQVKNQIGADQAMSFNQEVTGALTGLTQNLQGSKTQLEGALGVVTGQAPTVPGEDMGAPAADMGAEELPAELPAPEGEEEIDVDLEEPAAGGAADLGRARR
jgi:urease gamma subunit